MGQAINGVVIQMQQDFLNIFAMGGYGKYIWPCYTLLLVSILWHVVISLRKDQFIHAKVKRDLEDVRDQKTRR